MQDSMPPLSLDEMIAVLENPNYKTYLVLGKESEKAWKLGLAAQNFLPGVRSYLVKTPAQAEVKQHFNIPANHVGIVFGRSSFVSKTLTRTEANDFLIVTQAIANAT
jgi:deoxycytidine triphosphate deaminase